MIGTILEVVVRADKKRNKTSSAVRCVHRLSGAVGRSEDQRSQVQNKQTAFKRMAESKEFKLWLQMEIAKRNGSEEAARRYAEIEINSNRIKTEVKIDGKWTEVSQDQLMNEEEK